MGQTWTFGKKLGAGFTLVVVLTVAMGLVSLLSLRSVIATNDRIVSVTTPGVMAAQDVQLAAEGKVASVRGFLLTGNEKYAREVRERDETMNATLQRIRGLELSNEAVQLHRHMDEARIAHQREVEHSLTLRRDRGAGQLDDIVRVFDRRVIPAYETLVGRIDAFVALQRERLSQAQAEARSAAASANAIVIGIGTIAGLLSLTLAIFMTRSLTRQIGTSVQHIRSSSTELQSAATQQASGAKEQATAMNEISTTIGELLATSRQIEQSGQHVAKMASDSAESTRSGQDAVHEASEAVERIRQQVDTIARHMLDLGNKSQQIGGILEIINELAEQTNILAINATIEASGAGESGRRFAVVGEEIRKLADRVGGSTKEIRTLIEEIRSAVHSTIMATETGSKTVDAGAQRFTDLESVFARIGELILSTTEAGREIELSTKQQSTAVEQVNVAISNVAQATKETEASSGQTLQTASQLATLSNELTRLVKAQS